MRAAPTFSASLSRKKWALSATALMSAFLFTLAGCAAEVTEPEFFQETQAAEFHQVPEGCPTAEDVSEAFIQDSHWLEALNVNLLQGELETPLPDGGCGYAVTEVGTSSSSDNTFRRVIVLYFRLGEEGRISQEEIAEWGRQAGGVPHEERDIVTEELTGEFSDSRLDLPQTFTGWTGAHVSWVDGELSTFFFSSEDGTRAIPEYTLYATAKVDLYLDSDRVEVIIAQGGGGSAEPVLDPTEMLPSGLTATFRGSVAVSNDDGYTGIIAVTGKLQPWASDITNVPPGKFEAFTDASGQVTYTNTTDGRQTLMPTTKVWALYPTNSPACPGNGGVSVEGDGWQDSSFCRVSLGNTYDADLEPVAIVTAELERSAMRLGPLDESSDDLAILNAPIAMYVAFGTAGPLGNGNAWVGERGCYVNTQQGQHWMVVLEGWPEVLCK